MKSVFPFAALAAVVLAAPPVFAQPAAVPASPPAAVVNPAVSSVAQVLANGVDEQAVILEGSIIENLGDERYTFADSTGVVRVEIDGDDYPVQPIDRTTKLYLSGRIDKDSPIDGLEIDVDSVRIIE